MKKDISDVSTIVLDQAATNVGTFVWTTGLSAPVETSHWTRKVTSTAVFHQKINVCMMGLTPMVMLRMTLCAPPVRLFLKQNPAMEYVPRKVLLMKLDTSLAILVNVLKCMDGIHVVIIVF